MVTTEMKKEWGSVNVRYFVSGVVFLNFAPAYLAICTNAAVAGFHVRINQPRQPALLQVLANHCLNLMCRYVGTSQHSGSLRLDLTVLRVRIVARMHIRGLPHPCTYLP